MANVFVDLDKSASTEDGTTWANAYRLPSQIVSAAGDDVWIKGNTNGHSGSTLLLDLTAGTSSASNPVRTHGVKTATTNEPPVQSDLIPGWRTGETRTNANRAYNDADRPVIKVTDSNIFQIRADYIYGVEFQYAATTTFQIGGGATARPIYEECLIDIQAAAQVRVGQNNGQAVLELINCGYQTQDVGATLRLRNGKVTFIGLEYIATSVATTFYSAVDEGGTMIFHGADLSAASGNIVAVDALGASDVSFFNASLHASATLVTGTRSFNDPGTITFSGCSSVTSKSSGSLLDLTINEFRGDIVEETTAVRTGGANDGEAGAHSMAMTPTIDDTRENYAALVGPWMAFWVTNSDTTVDVFIANSGAADYNDDDAWLEVMDVSNAGTAQHTHFTTQMDLLATPSAITDDTGSTWGTGGNNHQKLSVTISPDFSGWSYCRVHFAKNFGASPETLYVDPNPITS